MIYIVASCDDVLNREGDYVIINESDCTSDLRIVRVGYQFNVI